MEQVAKVTLEQQIDKYLTEVKEVLTKTIGAEKTEKIFSDAAAYKIEWPTPEESICTANGILADDNWLVTNFGETTDLAFMDDDNFTDEPCGDDCGNCDCGNNSDPVGTFTQLIALKTPLATIVIDENLDANMSTIFPKWKEALSFMLALELAYKALAGIVEEVPDEETPLETPANLV